MPVRSRPVTPAGPVQPHEPARFHRSGPSAPSATPNPRRVAAATRITLRGGRPQHDSQATPHIGSHRTRGGILGARRRNRPGTGTGGGGPARHDQPRRGPRRRRRWIRQELQGLRHPRPGRQRRLGPKARSSRCAVLADGSVEADRLRPHRPRLPPARRGPHRRASRQRRGRDVTRPCPPSASTPSRASCSTTSSRARRSPPGRQERRRRQADTAARRHALGSNCRPDGRAGPPDRQGPTTRRTRCPASRQEPQQGQPADRPRRLSRCCVRSTSEPGAHREAASPGT